MLKFRSPDSSSGDKVVPTGEGVRNGDACLRTGQGRVCRLTGRLSTAAVALIAGPLTVTAAEWSIVPDVQLNPLYNDNILLNDTDPISVFGAILDVRAAAAVRSERSGLIFTPRLRFDRYSGEEGLNSDNQFFNLASWHETERVRLALDMNYDRETTVTSELETTGRVVAGVRRETFDIIPVIDYAVSDRSTVQFAYAYSDVRYDAPPIDTGLFNYEYQIAQATGSHRLNEVDEFFASALVSQFEIPDLPRTTTSYGIEAGWAPVFSDSLSARLSVGVRMSDDEFTVLGVQREESSTGPLWDFRLTKRFERTDLEASLTRTLSPTGSGALRERDQIRLKVDGRFSTLLSGRVDVSAFRNESLGAGDNSDTNFRVRIGLFRRLGKHWHLGAEYQYRRRESRDVTDDADSNAVFVSLRYSGRKWAWSQ
jgi:hypothetical protein